MVAAFDVILVANMNKFRRKLEAHRKLCIQRIQMLLRGCLWENRRVAVKVLERWSILTSFA